MARSHQAKRALIRLRRRWMHSTTRDLQTMKKIASTAVQVLDDPGERAPADLLETWESLRQELRRRGVQ